MPLSGGGVLVKRVNVRILGPEGFREEPGRWDEWRRVLALCGQQFGVRLVASAELLFSSIIRVSYLDDASNATPSARNCHVGEADG
jgi:hypothetical protein